MTRPFDRHLDSDELDALISLQALGTASSAQVPEQAIREAERHLDSCEDCHRKAQMHKFVQTGMTHLGAPGNVPPGPYCIEYPEWLRVAAGLLLESTTRDLMKHAAQCGHCGPLFRTAAETLSEDANPDEETLVASLTSARPEWQNKMAETLRANGAPDRAAAGTPSWLERLFSWPRPMFAAAAFVMVLVTGWLGVKAFRTPSADQLLAQAYTERRTLEVRIPGAKYAPMRVERGGGGSNFDKPESLLKAEALIGENLRTNPNDPTWLQAKARADLLDGNYESAIKTLQRALETQTGSPELLTDLGSAYFQRAESADRPIDYGNAIEELGKALAKTPDDPVALFNRALACERMFLFTQAVDDWQHYLRVDPTGPWADDARTRLAALQEKLKKHAERLAEPLLTPEEIAKAGPDHVTMRKKIDARIEDYLNTAVTEWLPKAFPVDQPKNGWYSRAALSILAKIASQKHDDQWLLNLLGARPSS